MRKLIATLLLLFLVGCSTQPQQEVVPEYIGHDQDQLMERLADSNANQLKGEIFYNIFPISFSDSNGDGYGDLQGIIKSLDYLQEMGVKGIWLNPIHPSPSYHKYDVTDYYGIDPQFGTMDDFKALIAALDERDMVLIMDMVMNHSSSQHPWFIKSMNNEEGYEDYYVKVDSLDDLKVADKKAWYEKNGQYYFGSFWSEMPEFNLDSPAVRSEFRKILKYWLDLGVDGFRYDAAKHAYDVNEYPTGTPVLRRNLQFWLEMKAYVKEINPQAYIIAEVWMDNQAMAAYAPSFDALFNFDFGDGVIEALRSSNSASFLSPYLKGQKFFEDQPNYLDGIFLKNHDQPRIASMFGRNEGQMKVAASILLTMPGNPYIYYGEDLGYSGIKPDERIREPYKWENYLELKTPTWETVELNKKTEDVQTQLNNSESMLNHYRTWGKFRSEHNILKTGDFTNLMTGNPKVLAYVRGDKYVVVHNLSNEVVEVDLEMSGTILLSSDEKNTLQDTLLKLEPYTSLIYEKTP